MKITLVNSNVIPPGSNVDSDMIDFPTGLLSLAACLEKSGRFAELIDLSWLIKNGELRVGPSLLPDACRIIARTGSDLLGFNTRCDTYPFVIRAARRCKEALPKSFIVLGGPQASFTAERTLEAFPFIDAVVRGEGERTLVEMVGRLERGQGLEGVAGVSYRARGGVVHNPERSLIEDIDSLPMPAYHLMDRYTGKGRRRYRGCRIYIQTGRGCPYSCTFCSSSLMFRGRCRLRSPQKMLAEIEFLHREYGIRRFVFGHDHLLANRPLVTSLCRAIAAKKLDIDWTCSARIDSIDPGILKTLAAGGCGEICFGIETGSARIQKAIRKNLDLSRIPTIVKECEAHGIAVVLSFIAGFPEETRKDLDATLNLALKYAAWRTRFTYVHLRLLSPMAGSPLLALHRKRLLYTGFWSWMTESPLARLKENEPLIREYPELFSSFYVMRSRCGSPEDLRAIVENFAALLIWFPLSFYCAVNELRLSPSELTLRFYQWIRGQHAVRWEGAITARCCMRLFPRFLVWIYTASGCSHKLVGRLAAAEKKRIVRYRKRLDSGVPR